VAALQVLCFYGLNRSLLGTSIAAMLPSLLIVFLTFREAGKIIEESFMYIAGPLLPAIAGSIIMLLAIGELIGRR